LDPSQWTNPRTRNDARREGGVDNRRKTLSDALTVLNERERRIFETRRLAEEQITLAELAEEFGSPGARPAPDRGERLEKVQNAVKNRIAVMEIPAASARATHEAIMAGQITCITKPDPHNSHEAITHSWS